MLNAHFACGDGRCNENIALSTIHQVFHSEHDRLVDDIKATLNDPANAAAAARPTRPAHPVDGAGTDVSFGYGGRLFQAARFVTEMEYQHLVFEEFARKMQPAIRPFHVYSPDINPAIEAEFAHAVYRFGHSMLDDDVARSDTNTDGSSATTAAAADGVPQPAGVLRQQRSTRRTPSTRPRRPQAPSSWAPRTRSATSSTSSSPRPCATTCSACRSTCRPST